MSFATDTKKELCMNSSTDVEVLRSEFYAMLLLCRDFTSEKIVFKTENKYTANRFVSLCSMLFAPIIERTQPLTKSSKAYTVRLIDSSDCKRIFDFYGHDDREISLRVNRANISDYECERAFVRGIFLSCGSVTDPDKGYHLELCLSHKSLCTDVCKLISEIEDLAVNMKMLNRNGSYIAYVKDSEQITDLLTLMGAQNSAMSVMGAKALKQIRNTVNRRANSEIANLEKVACASATQIKAIKKLEKSGKLLTLSDELKEVAKLRVEYPELSLRDMGEMLTPPISRSGVNHRLSKLIELSKEDD
ncbi:MAG: DNA-binding protein WhiA [Ruminococcus sp.]|nr:DNA-binding protein WhiA [Ruminococcus sp.]MBQ7133392.1 DNA-binding protein WhiA [Ruminococcus sp.]